MVSNIYNITHRKGRKMSDLSNLEQFDDWDLIEADIKAITPKVERDEVHFKWLNEEQEKRKQEKLNREIAEAQYQRKIKAMTKAERHAFFEAEFKRDWQPVIDQWKLEKEQADAERADYKRRKKQKENIESWRRLYTDSFHLSLIEYQKSHSQEDFAKVWPELNKITQRLAQKYLGKKLKMKPRILLLANASIQNNEEWLTEALLKAIDTWNCEKGIKFATYFSKIVDNLRKDYIVKANSRDFKDVELISVDTIYQEKIMDEIVETHYEYDKNDQMFMELYVKLFIGKLAEVDKQMAEIFRMLVLEKYTQDEVAACLQCSKKTVQRKMAEIKRSCREYFN